MKHFFRTQKIWIICFSVIAIITIALLTIKTDYYIIAPAVITNTEDVFQYKNDDEDENKIHTDIHTVSVYGYYDASLFGYLLSLINPFTDEFKLSKVINTSTDYDIAQGNIDKNMSIDNAYIVGYKEAGVELNSTFQGFKVNTVYTYCDEDIKLGDTITHLNGIKLTEDNTFNKVALDLLNNGEKEFKVTLTRVNQDYKGETKEVKIEYYPDYKNFGFSSNPYFIIGNNCKFEKNPNYSSLGPSGGLMQALYIYEQLTGCKLTQGHKIAGTGGINDNGDAGLIGGMRQKIFIANANNCDIFFVPVEKYIDKDGNVQYDYSNLDEAEDAMKLLKLLGQDDMKIVPVKNLSEVIDYLEGLQ